MRIKLIIIFLILFGSLAAFAQPIADFSANKVSGCAPALISFSDLSTGSPVSWAWDFGNGNTSAIQNPSVIYTTPGTYTVKLTIKDAANASSVKTQTAYIKIFSLPVADFTSDKKEACPYTPFSFTDKSAPNGATGGAITQWQWDFGDGGGANTQNTSHAYSLSGSYQVKLTITDANGCAAFKEIPGPLVYPKPGAAFTPSKTSSCLTPAVISFTNKTPNGVSYQWDFGDGNTSTQASPSNTFNTAGTYAVKLVATSANGCKDSSTVNISIGNNKADFTAPTAGCQNTPVTFVPTVNGALSYTFLFGDGGTSTDQTPVTHSYSQPGTYNVSFIAMFGDGCADTVKKTITIDEKPDVKINYTPKSACLVPFNITFTNPVLNSTSLWDFGDGQTSNQRAEIHTYNSKGPFVVTLKVTTTGGCEATKTDTIQFQPKLNIISSKKQFCGATEGKVDFNFNPEYTTPTNPLAFNWDFGDGNTSNLRTPSHTYTTEGKFIVKLALTYAGGCVIEGYDTISVFTYPVPNFTVNLRDVCVKKTINFTNLSTNYDSLIWDFGDKILEYKKVLQPSDGNTTHQYRNPITILKLTDTFDIKLTVFNGPCMKDTTFKKYIRVRAPLAYTEPVTLYCDTPANANLIDISRYQNPRDSVTRLWVFGDPNADKTGTQPCTVDSKNGFNIGRNCNQSVDSITSHIYRRFGNYNAYLRTYSQATGCLDSFTFTIKVRPKYNLNFTSSADTGCAPLTITLKDTTRTSVKWLWKFNDPAFSPGDTAVSKDTVWKYNRPGNYTVGLLGTDTSGCQQIASKRIVVRGPLANFSTVGKLCPPDTVNFNDLTVKTSRIEKWRWKFGDPASGAANDTSNLQNTKHKFSGIGNFVVSLTVVDSEQCSNTISRLISYGPPKPIYSVDRTIICETQGVLFTNSTTGSNTYKWYFGDGDSSTLRNVNHTYKDTGTFDVKLIARRNDGCMDSIQNISVRVVKPQVQFTADNTNAFCPPFTVRFNDSVSTDIIAWRWDFGDSTYSTIANPIKTYNKPGSYTVKLVAVSAGGCEDSVIFVDYIKVGGPAGSFAFTPKTGCTPLGVSFKANAQGQISLYTWDFGDGNIKSGSSDSGYHVYTNNGTFKPVMILTDTNNCSISFSTTDSVYLLPGSKASFRASDTAICIGGSVLFTDNSTTPPGVNIVSRLWNFGDLATATSNPVAHIYTTSGSFDVSLAILDSRGCTDTVTKPAYIQSTLNPTVTVSNDTAICYGAEAPLNASGGVTYRWSPATGLSATDIPNPIARPEVTTTYRVAAKGAGNCDSAFATVIITVNQLPTVLAGNDTYLCKDDSVQLNATSSGNRLAWHPAFGLSDTTVNNPFVKISTDTTYYLQVTDLNYCVNTDSVRVSVVPPPVAEIDGVEKVCYGAVVNLVASGGEKYLWSTGDTATRLIVNIKKDTSYWVIPSAKGCVGTPDTIKIEISGDVIEANFTTIADTLFTFKEIEFFNTSQGAVAYRWDLMWGILNPMKTFTSVNPVYEYKRAGTYTVQLIATSDIGCSDTIYKDIYLVNNNVYIPNAFSPDGDKINDIFNFVASDKVDRFEFMVYNRWGQLVFKTDQEDEGWDGTYGNEPAQQDAYVYVFDGIVNNKKVQLSGTVTLLR